MASRILFQFIKGSFLFFLIINIGGCQNNSRVQNDFNQNKNGNNSVSKIDDQVKPFPVWRIDGFKTELIQSEESSEVFPKQCSSGILYYAWGMGSGSAQVIGLEDNKCHLAEFNEEEGGYKRFECFVPVNFRRFTIYKYGRTFYYSENIAEFCEKPKIGNMLVEQEKLNRKK